MVSTPAELREWRVGADATQADAAEVLGISDRAWLDWENGHHPMPPTLPWALIAVRPHVESLVAYRRRKASTARRRAAKRKSRRRTAATRAAARAIVRESMRERRAEIESQNKAVRDRMHESLRIGERWVAKMQREGRIRAPGSSFLKPPRAHAIRPRKIRKDSGQPHRFRGRPGYPLRPQDIQHED